MLHIYPPHQIKDFKNNNKVLFKNIFFNLAPLERELSLRGVVSNEVKNEYVKVVNGVNKPIYFRTYVSSINFEDFDSSKELGFEKFFRKLLATIDNEGVYLLSFKSFYSKSNKLEIDNNTFFNSVIETTVEYELARLY